MHVKTFLRSVAAVSIAACMSVQPVPAAAESRAADPVSAHAQGLAAPTSVEFEQALASDCNDNGVEDAVDIAVGYSSDFDGNGIPDECDARRR